MQMRTHRGLDHHGPLVPHGSHDVQWIHRLTALHQTHRSLHGDEHSSPANPSAGQRDRGGFGGGGVGESKGKRKADKEVPAFS